VSWSASVGRFSGVHRWPVFRCPPRVLEDLIRATLNEWALREDWPKQRQRLVWWLRQEETARELYGRGQAEALRVLCDYGGCLRRTIRGSRRGLRRRPTGSLD
jgi:hypothetical protein